MHLTRAEKQQQWIDRELSDVSSVYSMQLSLVHQEIIIVRSQCLYVVCLEVNHFLFEAVQEEN